MYRNRAPRGTDAFPWLIAATPVLPVAVLFAWHPRTWLDNADPGEVDPAFVAVIVAVLIALVLGAVLARIDAARLRDNGVDHPARWQWAMLGAPTYLLVRSRSVRGGGARWPALLSAAIALVGIAVAVQKLVEAALAAPLG